jgi:hypothetical protein
MLHEEKRRLRRDWHRLRTSESKRLLNTETQEQNQLLNNNKNHCIQTFLQGVTPAQSTDYSLWKATKEITQVKKSSPSLRTSQGTWARSNAVKAHAFDEHLAKVFQPHPSGNEPEEALTQLLEIPYQLEPPINRFKRAEVQEVINSLNPKKLSSIVKINRLIPNHQFGFRQRHSTIEKTHRVVRKINVALENKQHLHTVENVLESEGS